MGTDMPLSWHGEELGPRPVADGEHEQAEQSDPQHGRKRESAKLPDQHRHDQRTRRGAERKFRAVRPASEPPTGRATGCDGLQPVRRAMPTVAE